KRPPGMTPGGRVIRDENRYGRTTAVPGRLIAPGPGSAAAPSIRRLPDLGTQKVAARVVDFAVLVGRPPTGGTPTSRIERQSDPETTQTPGLGQSPATLQPLPSLEPPLHILVPQVPPPVQSALVVHGAPLLVPRRQTFDLKQPASAAVWPEQNCPVALLVE